VQEVNSLVAVQVQTQLLTFTRFCYNTTAREMF
jgi:hypothetical protein